MPLPHTLHVTESNEDENLPAGHGDGLSVETETTEAVRASTAARVAAAFTLGSAKFRVFAVTRAESKSEAPPPVGGVKAATSSLFIVAATTATSVAPAAFTVSV